MYAGDILSIWVNIPSNFSLFSFLFKKTQGMTPTQYRGLKSAEGEG